MIKNKKEERKYLNFVPYKKIYATLLDWLILLILALGILFGLVAPILSAQTSYQELTKQKDDNYATVQNIGIESKLIAVDSSSHTNYTFDMMFKMYVAEHILLSYEYSPNNLSDVGFKTDLIDKSIPKASYNDDFLGYFYTNYLVDKKDENNLLIVASDNYKEYYCQNILKIDENDWWVKDGDNIPHLKDDYARYLTEYVLLGRSYSTIRNVYQNFEAYFSSLYSKAGSDLMKVPAYINAYNNYNDAYDKLNTIRTNWTNIVTGILFLLTYIVYPLVRGNYQTLGCQIFHLGYININHQFKYYHYLLRIAGSFITTFFILGLVGLIFVGSSYFGIVIFSLGSSAFTVGIGVGLSLIINLISFITTLFTRKGKDFGDLISGTQDYEIIY